MLLDGQTVYKNLDNFNALALSFEGDNFCNAATSGSKALIFEKCVNVYDGILNNGLTATLFLFLQKIEEIKLNFDSRVSFSNKWE